MKRSKFCCKQASSIALSIWTALLIAGKGKPVAVSFMKYSHTLSLTLSLSFFLSLSLSLSLSLAHAHTHTVFLFCNTSHLHAAIIFYRFNSNILTLGLWILLLKTKRMWTPCWGAGNDILNHYDGLKQIKSFWHLLAMWMLTGTT